MFSIQCFTQILHVCSGVPYLCCSILREDERVDVRQDNHVQDRTPTRLQGARYQRAKVETEEREGVFRRRGEPLDRDGELWMKKQRNDENIK